MSTHYRVRLLAPKSRQQVRLAAVAFAGSPRLCGWNNQHRDGRYRRWYCDATGNIGMCSSVDASAVVWEFCAVCTDETHCSEPRGWYDRLGVLHLLYTCRPADTPEVRERSSFDDGKTWSDPTVAFASGSHPTLSVGLDGTVIRAAYLAASGKIQATRQETGRAASSPFYLQDDTATDLLFEDDTFHLVQGLRGDAPWLLIATIQGEGSTSDWISSDDCLTWKRL